MDINRLSRNSVEHHKDTDQIHKCNEYKNVSICLIDIVGFSKWCTKHDAKTVINSMIKYNDLINRLLFKFDKLTKIELVGDSCLIVGGMHDSKCDDYECDVFEMVSFCSILLSSNIDVNIFQSESITVRIGVHIGDLFGTFMDNPTKFQLYGNDINTTSRLESSSLPGVIHISDKVMSRLQESRHRLGHLDLGNIIPKFMKGVGEVQCAYLTKYDDDILVVEDLKICQMVIGQKLKEFPLKYLSDLESAIDKLKRKMYKTVLLDIYTETYCILEDFKLFRAWETLHRNAVQHVIAVTVCDDLPLECKVLFNNIVSKGNIKELVDIVSTI